jgi:hypothetical protein
VVDWKRVCWIGSGLDVLDDEKKLGWRVVRWVFLYLLDKSFGWLHSGGQSLSLLCLVRFRYCGEGRYSVLLHGRVCYGDANP